MELSIIEAGKLCKVHRNTLHEWIKKGWIHQNKKNGMVETTEIVERLQVKGRTNGRVAGWAYEDAELSKNADIGITLERGVVILSDVLKPLSPAQQSWIRRTIFARIGDPKLLEQKEVATGTSKRKPRETRQERAWNNVMVRGPLNPKVHIYSQAIRAWAKKFKRVVLLEEAKLDVPEKLLRELDLIIEPPKPQSVESK
jgi:hypothetical protein